MTTWPKICAEVSFDLGDGELRSTAGVHIADLLWNPKGGEGHVLIKEVRCGEPLATGPHPEWKATCGVCGDCMGWGLRPGGTTMVCECGEDDHARDHHYWLLRSGPHGGDAGAEIMFPRIPVLRSER